MKHNLTYSNNLSLKVKNIGIVFLNSYLMFLMYKVCHIKLAKKLMKYIYLWQ